MKECRVLQMLTALGVGGAETWMMALLRYYREAADRLNLRVRLDFCLTGGAKAAFDAEAEALGARLYYLRYTRRRVRRFGAELASLLAENRYHAIHNHADYAAAPQWLMALQRLPPVRAVHVHNPMFFPARISTAPTRFLLVEAEKQFLARVATHVLGTSREILSVYGFDRPLFRRLSRRAVHCGFDVTPFAEDRAAARAALVEELAVPADAVWVLFVGRLGGDQADPLSREVDQKNPGFALQTMRRLVTRDHRFHFLVAGGGRSHIRRFEALAAEWDMAANVRFLGVRHDVPRLMAASDLLLFPSRAEGLGMVTVEAQAAGLRVLASDTTPRECVVIDNMVTFLPLAAGPEAWAREVERLAQSPRPDRVACNRAVRNSLFSIENSAAALADIYSQGIT